MQKYSTSQYNGIFYKLPAEIQDVLIRYDTSEHLWKIGESHKLHIDKVGIMHDLAMDVMMGIIASKNFVRELQNELGIPALDASALARDIDEEIFKPIKNTMIKLYGDGAPYKPSSSLVQFYEEDEEHKTLDKDTLLKEIENPAGVKIRVENNSPLPNPPQREGLSALSSLPSGGRGVGGLETAEEVKELKDMERRVGVNTQRPIEIKKVGMHLEGARAAPEGISSTLDKIASLKLSKTFVMPRGGDAELNLQGRSLQDSKGPSLGAKVSATQKPESAPYTPPAPKNYGVDPYREPLN